jgi:hypothetical protein
MDSKHLIWNDYSTIMKHKSAGLKQQKDCYASNYAKASQDKPLAMTKLRSPLSRE